MSLDFYLDAATGKRVQSPAYAVAATDTPSAKLMSTQTVRIQYLNITAQKGTPTAAPSTALQFGLKQGTVALGNYADTTFDAYTDAFTAPTDPTLSTAYYTATLTIDSTALRALFPVNASGQSVGFVPLIGEILSGGVPSDTFAFNAQNNVIKGTESPAVSVPGASGYPTPVAVNTAVAQAAVAPVNLSGVTQRTGGTSASLDSVVTIGQPAGLLVMFTEAATGDIAFFRLVAGAGRGQQTVTDGTGLTAVATGRKQLRVLTIDGSTGRTRTDVALPDDEPGIRTVTAAAGATWVRTEDLVFAVTSAGKHLAVRSRETGALAAVAAAPGSTAAVVSTIRAQNGESSYVVGP